MKKLLLTIIAVFTSFSVFGQFDEIIEGELTTEDQVAIGNEIDGNFKLTVGGNLSVGGSLNSILKVRQIKGKKYNSTALDHLYLNYNTGKDVMVGKWGTNASRLLVTGATTIGKNWFDPNVNYKLTVSGNVNVGGAGNGRLKTRHIDGKHWASAEVDNLYLNHNTGKDVYVGNINGTQSNLLVSGGIQIGNVDIPTGFRLAVDGKVKVEEVQVQMSDFWDDVFMEETYDLMSIDEKEAYTQENKHLPSFPAEAEIIAEGMELGEGIANTVKELEEAYRYIYQLNAAVKELQSSVEEVVEKNKELTTENLDLKSELEGKN